MFHVGSRLLDQSWGWTCHMNLVAIQALPSSAMSRLPPINHASYPKFSANTFPQRPSTLLVRPNAFESFNTLRRASLGTESPVFILCLDWIGQAFGLFYQKYVLLFTTSGLGIHFRWPVFLLADLAPGSQLYPYNLGLLGSHNWPVPTTPSRRR